MSKRKYCRKQRRTRRSKQWGGGGYVFQQNAEKGKTLQVKHLSLTQLEQLTSQVRSEAEAEILSQVQSKQTITTEEMQEQKETLLPTPSEQPKEVTLPLYDKTLILRKLTPKEKERLMGFPEEWTDLDLSDAKRGHGLGNSIVPQCAEWILKRIKKYT